MSTALYILAYILLGIAQAMRYREHSPQCNGYSIEHILMTAWHGLFWWASLFGEAVMAAIDAAVTVYLWPRGEKWRRLKHAIQTKVKRHGNSR